MTIRLGQKRPALAHLPIALLPMSAAAAESGAIGLFSGEETNAESESMDMPIFHRKLDDVATVVAGGMAAWRVGAFGRTAGVNFVYGVKHFVQEANEGKLAPTIMTILRK